MQITRIILCLALVLSAATPSSAARREKKAAVQRKSPLQQKKKKVRAKPTPEKRKVTRKKPSEQAAPARAPAEKKESPKVELKLEDTRWMDPTVLRDTLFLSAEKRIPKR